MPTAALHSHYWQQDWQEAPVVAGGGGGGGYTPWQMTVIGCGFGSAQVVYEWLARRIAQRAACPSPKP